MTKVTLKEAPAATHEPKKSKTATLQDSTGRTIVVRDLDPMQKARLVMAMGGEVAANSVYMSGFAIPCAMVTHVDDDFFGMPQNVKQVETMLSILGEEGLDCITNYLIERHETQTEAQRKAAESAEQAAAKLGTDPEFIQDCWLVKNGAPFDRVFDCDFLEPHEKFAMSIVFSELEGNEFNWSTMKFVEKT